MSLWQNSDLSVKQDRKRGLLPGNRWVALKATTCCSAIGFWHSREADNRAVNFIVTQLIVLVGQVSTSQADVPVVLLRRDDYLFNGPGVVRGLLSYYHLPLKSR